MIWESRSSVKTGLSPSDPEWWFEYGVGSGNSESGETVNAATAQKTAVAWRCIDLISSTLGTLPIKYYKAATDGSKDEVRGAPLWGILHDTPNSEMTAVELWTMLLGHVALRGNAYCQIIRRFSGGDEIEAIWPLNPANMVVSRKSSSLLYEYTESNGNQREFGQRDIFHIRTRMSDGLVGMSPLEFARDAIGLRISQEKFASKLFKNGARFPFVWMYPGKFKDNQKRKETESALNDAYAGADNAHKSPLLEQGLDIKTVGMTAEDAETIAHADFSVLEVCRFFGVPPHKAYMLRDATYSNIEEQNTDWVVDTVRAYAETIEAAIQRDLVPQAQKADYFAEFNLDALLRGNTEDRWNANRTAIETGVASINDIRKRENWNPIDGGDVHLVPLNYIPLDQIGDLPVSTEPNGTDERSEERTIATRMRIRNAYEPLFIDAFQRIVHREVRDHRNAIKKFLGDRTVGEFELYLTRYYEKLPEALRKTFTPLINSYARAMFEAVGAEVNLTQWTPDMDRAVSKYVRSLEAHYSAGGEAQLKALMRDHPDELDKVLNTRLNEWDTRKAKKMTRIELVRSGEEIAMATYRAAGVTKKRWHTVGKSCPMCNYWNGRVVGIEENFAAKGSLAYFKPGEEPYKAKRNIMTAPLHDKCDCIVRADI